jgi:integrase
LKEPKTKGSRRRIRLTQETMVALNAHRQRMMKDGLYAKDGLVFVDSVGGPLRKSNVHRTSFKPAMKKAKVKAIRFHDMRHTAATTWLANGINIKAVSSRLGHAKIQITLDTYFHFLP